VRARGGLWVVRRAGTGAARNQGVWGMRRAVCLDLGGTLVERRRHLDLVAYWRLRGVCIDPQAAAAAIHRVDHAFMQHLPDLWREAGARFHARYWPEVHRGLGLPSPDPAVAARWGGPWRCFPDALPTVWALRRAGLALALVSNWDDSGHMVLRETGLAGAFAAVVLSCEEGCSKPDPRLFLTAAARLGVPPQECLHVGDNPWDDLVGAARAGMGAALLHRHPEWLPPPREAQRGLIMHSLRDLLLLLGAGLPAATTQGRRRPPTSAAAPAAPAHAQARPEWEA
jgi:HAD superfamily hydrolase (TIGR01493 family)